MDDKPSLDPVEVARLLVGLFLSQKVAAVVGPYAVILLAAMGGAAFRVANKDTQSWQRTAVFFFTATILGTFAAVPMSMWISSYYDKVEAQWLFVPVAAGLAYATDRLPELGSGVIDAIKRLIKNWGDKGTS